MAASSATMTARADGDIDLGQVGRALWARRLWILIPTVAVGLLTFVAVNMITPRYKSEARILFEGRENVFLQPNAEKAPESAVGDQEAVANQVQVVLSRDVALEVIRKLRLIERSEFAQGGVSSLRYMMMAFGLAKDTVSASPEDRLLDTFAERLTAYAVDKSRVIVAEFQSSSPELSAEIVNAVADAYIARQRFAKQDQSRGASAWLAGEIDRLRSKVAEAEGKVESFRSKANLLVGTNNTTLSNQQLGELNSQLGTSRAQKSDAESRAKNIRELLRKGEAIEASEVLNSESMRRLSDQRSTLLTQLAEQSSTLLDGHPRIKEIKAQIGEVNSLIRAEAEKLVRTFENDAKLAGARLDALSASLDTLKRQAGSNNEQDVQLRALDREAKAQRDLLESYLARYREALSRESIGDAPTANARIISRGVAPNTPYFPKKTPTILIATLAAFMLSAGFVMTGEILRAGVFGAGVPVSHRQRAVAMEPQVVAEPVHPALGVSVRAIAEVARRLMETADMGRRVAVFSAGDGVATSLAALTLARALSRESRVVLVDLAPGNPNLSAVSSDPHAPGLADAISGACSFGDIITRDKLSRLHLVTGGATGGEMIPLLASPQFFDATEALARSYDYFVIDAGTAPEAMIGRIAAIAPRAMLVAPPGSDAGVEVAYKHFVAVGFTDVAVATGISSPPPTTPQPAVLDRRAAI